MTLLGGMLAANALLHAIVVGRFGLKGNEPFLAFVAIYGALAWAVYAAVSHALWAVLVLSACGIVGLSVTFNKAARDKTLDKAIWALDAATILYTAYLLFAA